MNNVEPVRWDWICCEADHGSSSNVGPVEPSITVTGGLNHPWGRHSPDGMGDPTCTADHDQCSAPVICCDDEDCPATTDQALELIVPTAKPQVRPCHQCFRDDKRGVLTPPSCCDPACLGGGRTTLDAGRGEWDKQIVCGEDGYRCTDEECKALEAYLASCAAHDPQHHSMDYCHTPRESRSLPPTHPVDSIPFPSPSADVLGLPSGISTDRSPMTVPSWADTVSHPYLVYQDEGASSYHDRPSGVPQPHGQLSTPSFPLLQTQSSPLTGVQAESDLHEPRWSTTEVHALLQSLSSSPLSNVPTPSSEFAREGEVERSANSIGQVSGSTITISTPWIVPPSPRHTCHWSNCHLQFTSVQDLLRHIGNDHLNDDPGKGQAGMDGWTRQSGAHCQSGYSGDTGDTLYPAIGSGHVPPEAALGATQTIAPSPGLMACLWDNCLPESDNPVAGICGPFADVDQMMPAQPFHGTTNATCAGVHPHGQDILLDSTEALLRHLLESHLARTGTDAAPLSGTLAASIKAPSEASPKASRPRCGSPRSAPVSSARAMDAKPTDLPRRDSLAILHCRWAGCAATFPDAAGLTMHLSEDHVGSNKSIYECLWAGCEMCEEKGCDDCGSGSAVCLKGRQFASRQKIMRHLQSHTGYRPFLCPMCKQLFSEQATLSAHLRRHANERPFKCDHPGCDKAFAVMASLTIHRRVHEGDKKHKCPHCDKAFVEVSNMTKHMRIHTGEKPFACQQCARKFSRLDQLKRHVGSHERSQQEPLDTSSGSEATVVLHGQQGYQG